MGMSLSVPEFSARCMHQQCFSNPHVPFWRKQQRLTLQFMNDCSVSEARGTVEDCFCIVSLCFSVVSVSQAICILVLCKILNEKKCLIVFQLFMFSQNIRASCEFCVDSGSVNLNLSASSVCKSMCSEGFGITLTTFIDVSDAVFRQFNNQKQRRRFYN